MENPLESKKLILLLHVMYDTSPQLFLKYRHEFQEEDYEIQGNRLTEVRNTLNRTGMHTKFSVTWEESWTRLQPPLEL